MSEPDLDSAVRRVLLGENKVCGLTQATDAAAAYQAGARFGGVIFAERSPRKVDLAQAQLVMQGAPLRYVGVFSDAPAAQVADYASQLGLFAVQLHGNEDQAYVNQLRPLLPASCQIWKALSVTDQLPSRDWQQVDRYLFDQGRGGTGKSFDWALLAGQSLDNVMLAGGLNSENCAQAATLGCIGLDFNSGVESQPGIKDHQQLAQVFQTLRNY